MRTLGQISCVVAIMAAASQANAQHLGAGVLIGRYGGGGGYGGGGYDSDTTPGTVLGGNLRGEAAVIRSKGLYNELTSQGLINLEEARRLGLQNHRQEVEEYFGLRTLNEESRARESGRRGTFDDYARMAQMTAPQRLGPGELDVASGRILWPILLRDPAYDAARAELERFFAARATGGSVGAGDFLRIEQTAQNVLDQLRSRVGCLPPSQYVVAKRFLESLAYEASLPA